MIFISQWIENVRTVPSAAALLALVWCNSAAPTARCGEPELTLRLTSGREVRGHMDGTSNAQQLVLRTTRGGITLRRPIEWQRVDRVTAAGERILVSRLRAVAAEQERQQAVINAQRVPAMTEIQLRGVPSDTAPNFSRSETAARQVASVAMDPQIGNWDGDVEVDGLIVDVAPLDFNRNIVPTNGTVEVELFAPQRRTFDLAPLSGGDTLEMVERWTRAVTPADFGAYGVRLRLPFGAVHPELRPDWTASTYGLVHIRLVAPGHGVFEDSRDGVRIRPWAPNRDRLEMKTGQRFMPTESLGRRD